MFRTSTMHILAVVDIHGSKRAIREIQKKARGADLILNAGDFSIFEAGIEECLDKLDKLKKRQLLIHGNHEVEEDCRELAGYFRHIEFIHRKAVKVANYLFLGYGGGGFSQRDDLFERTAKQWAKRIKELRKKEKGLKVILMTHGPPHKTALDRIARSYVGNKSIKKFILEAEPDLFLCGHIHENAGKEQKIGRTRLINPGPFGKIIQL